MDSQVAPLLELLIKQKTLIEIYWNEWCKRPKTKTKTLLQEIWFKIHTFITHLESKSYDGVIGCYSKYYHFINPLDPKVFLKLPKSSLLVSQRDVTLDLIEFDVSFNQIVRESKKLDQS